MKLPSIDATLQRTVAAFRRFPLPILSALMAAYLAVSSIELNIQDAELTWWYLKKCLVLLFTIPAFIAIDVMNEQRKQPLLRWGLHVLFIAYCCWLHEDWTSDHIEADWAFFALNVIAVHLLVSFAPFIFKYDMTRFWEYNKSIFLRILTSGLYSGVLFAGLSLAILAIDHLFEADIKDIRYPQLFMVIAMVFNTWFFLSGYPKENEEESVEYPKGLRVFTQFVLLPLVTIYLLILYVYAAKILLTMHWPSGWVSYLVIGFSTAGILALLLIWPLRDNENHRWIKIYSKGFFFALFPLVVLLFFSIYLRVNQYGITMNRYFVIMLALWLLFVASYFLISKSKRIKMIPVSLFLVACISAFGPFSAFQVSKRSQFDRLITIGEKYGFYKHGKFEASKSRQEVEYQDEATFSSVLEYMLDTYDRHVVQDLFSENVDSIAKNKGSGALAQVLMTSIGLDYVHDYAFAENETFSVSSKNYNNPLSVTGYDYCFTWDYYSGKKSEDERMSLNDSLEIVLNFNGDVLKFMNAGGEELGMLRVSDLRSKITTLHNQETQSVEPEEMIAMVENDRIKAKVCFKYIYGKLKNSSAVTESINSVILVKLK